MIDQEELERLHEAAMAEMELRQDVLDITNADHIVLWLEANIKDSPIAWLACRIIEAHENILTAENAALTEKVERLEEALEKIRSGRSSVTECSLIARAALKGEEG